MSLPYDYLPAVLDVIEQISQGRTMTDACRQVGLPLSTFRRVVKNDLEMQALLDEADQEGRDAMAEALVNIDNHDIHGHSNPQMAKVVSDNIKWLLSKRDPKKFGERVTVEHDVSLDITITSALNAARFRTKALPPPDVEDAEFVDVEGVEAEMLRALLS